MADRTGVIIVGAGRSGYRHAMAAARTPRAELLGFYDTIAGAAESKAREFGVPSFSTLEDAFNQRRPFVAIICTPPNTHGELALKALEANAHVLVEKPFDVDLETIEQVALLAQSRGLAAGAVAQHRFADDAARLRDWIRAEGRGEIESASIRVQRHRSREYFEASAADWRKDAWRSGGGVLITIGFHYLDLACWMLGELRAREAGVTEEIDGVELAIEAELVAGALPCTVSARWGRTPNLEDTLSIGTSRGAIELRGDRLAVGYPPGLANESAPPFDRFELHARQLSDLLLAIDEGRPPLVGPRDVEPALRLIQAVYKLARRQ